MTTPTLSGVHSVTFPVTDLDGAMTWFETVFEARHLPELDHHDENGDRLAVVLRLPGIAPIAQLRHTEGAPGISQVALGVTDPAELERWAVHFDGHGVPHSGVLTARAGHVMTCTMPGGPTLLLYAGQADEGAAGSSIS
jgi:hypothetical protein